MRLLFLFALPLLLAACSRSVAGLTIPPNQAFVLGEDMDSGYRVSLVNRGTVAVTVQLIDKQSGEERARRVLNRGGNEEIYVEPGVRVRMVNATAARADILVTMSKGVQGMRLEDLEGKAVETISPAAREAERGPVVVKNDRGPARRKVSTELPAGQELIVGEGTSKSYSAAIRVGDGRGIKVSVRDKRSGRQRQGFGLGAPGSETVNIGPEEDLHLLNTGDRTVRISIALSEAVSGVRVAAIETR